MYFMFHDFATTGCQCNWSVISSLALVPFLEQGCLEGSFPVIRKLTFFHRKRNICVCQGWCNWRGHLLQESWWGLVWAPSFMWILTKRQFLYPIYLDIEGGGAVLAALVPNIIIKNNNDNNVLCSQVLHFFQIIFWEETEGCGTPCLLFQERKMSRDHHGIYHI